MVSPYMSIDSPTSNKYSDTSAQKTITSMFSIFYNIYYFNKYYYFVIFHFEIIILCFNLDMNLDDSLTMNSTIVSDSFSFAKLDVVSENNNLLELTNTKTGMHIFYLP